MMRLCKSVTPILYSTEYRMSIAPTKNPRINVTFEAVTAGLLAHLAHQEHKSLASLVKELTLKALEIREDFYLSKMAEKLDQKDVKTYSHGEVWK